MSAGGTRGADPTPRLSRAGPLDRLTTPEHSCPEARPWSGTDAPLRRPVTGALQGAVDPTGGGAGAALPRLPPARPGKDVRYFAGALRAQQSTLSQPDESTTSSHVHEPLGGIGRIIPRNLPVVMGGWKPAPALAADNAGDLEPAEPTPPRPWCPRASPSFHPDQGLVCT